MKKILTIFTVCMIVLASLTGCTNKNTGETVTAVDENVVQTVKYKTAKELAEKFISVCKDADIDEMYALYYNDMLTKAYDRTKNNLTKEQFNEIVIGEMQSIVDYELSEYGTDDMQASTSPLFNLNYFYYRATGEEIDLTEEMVTSCANIRVFFLNGGYTDHAFAEINGSWYVIL